MRSYIRHPSDIPIEYQADKESTPPALDHLKDIGGGGLSFVSAHEMKVHTPIKVRIPHVQPEFTASGEVIWCREEDSSFLVGVAFVDADDRFRMRMVEQVCYIEHYKAEVLATQGRVLSGEQAAKEWIEKFAAEFPGV